MAGKRNKGSVDEDIFRALWDWATEVDLKSGHALRYAFTPTERKGVWHLRAQVVSVVEGRALAVILQVEDVWPAAAPVSFSGACFALHIRLAELYERWRGSDFGP